MANCMIGFPNYIDSTTLSGGSWLSSLPVNNLKDRKLGKVCRSTNALAASTLINIDLGKERNIRVVDLVNHNISIYGKFRVRGSNDSSFTTSVYDSGWQDVWPIAYPYGTLEWEDDNWWDGKYTAEQLAGYVTNTVHLLPSNTLSRYWRIEIDDTTNPSAYIQMGRIFIGPVWQPSLNMRYGAETGLSTRTTVQAVLGGGKRFKSRKQYRTARIEFPYLPEDEALGNGFELERRAGIDQEVLWVHDPDDTMHAIRRRFMGTLNKLNGLRYPTNGRAAAAYEIEELQS